MTGIYPRTIPGFALYGALRGKPRGICPAVEEKMPLQASIFSISNNFKLAQTSLRQIA